MARRLTGDGLIDDTKKIAAAVEDAKHLLEETLDNRCINGKDLDRLLLRLSTLHAFDADKPPAFLKSQPVFIPVFDGTEYPPMVYDDAKAETVIKGARNGDRDADAVLCEIAAAFNEDSCFIMPPALRTYVGERLRALAADVTAQSRLRGRKIHTNLRRNLAIVTAVAELVGCGFYATRNEGTERECACSIVAKALTDLGGEITYSAVVKIWAEHAYLARMPEIIRLVNIRWKQIPGFSFV